MASSSSKARQAQAAQVAARSANSSGTIKCYVEAFERPDGRPELRLREKMTRRRVRVVTGEMLLQHIAPLANLLRDCYVHGGALTQPRNRKEHIAISAPIVTQNAQEIAVGIDEKFSVKVRLVTADVIRPPVSVWCYIEEYFDDNGDPGLRLRQKVTGRKIEMYGKTKEHLTTFLASPRFTGAQELMPNLYEQEGFRDYVLVSGGTAVDSYDVVLFHDGAQLVYLLGPSPDTAYRDAFRAVQDESAAEAHARTAAVHYERGHYREVVLAARLAVEMASGGRSADIKPRLEGAPAEISTAANALFKQRNIAVHEGGTRVEQPDARQAIASMKLILGHLAA